MRGTEYIKFTLINITKWLYFFLFFYLFLQARKKAKNNFVRFFGSNENKKIYF